VEGSLVISERGVNKKVYMGGGGPEGLIFGVGREKRVLEQEAKR